VLACQVTANSVDEALALEKRLRQLDTVGAVDSVAPLLAGNQQDKLALVRQIHDAAAGIRFAPMETASLDLPALDLALQSFQQVLGGALYAVGRSGNTNLQGQLVALRESVDDLRQAIASGSPALCAEKLTYYQQALFSDLAGTLQALQEQDYHAPLICQAGCAPASSAGRANFCSRCIRNKTCGNGRPRWPS